MDTPSAAAAAAGGAGPGGAPGTAVAAALRGLLGWELWFVLAGGAAVGWAIIAWFDRGDHWLPAAFVAVEIAVAWRGLVAAWAEGRRLTGALAGEERRMELLGASGGDLGGSLVLVNDLRAAAIREAEERARTWPNSLILLGMIGTAIYLVSHAGHFRPSGDLKASELKPLLALAPKAFAATGLALWCALWVNAAGRRRLGAATLRALPLDRLVGAWRGHFKDHRGGPLEVAFDRRVVARLEELPSALAEAARGTVEAVAQAQASARSFAGEMKAVADQLARVADAGERQMATTTSLVGTLAHASAEAVGLLERLGATEASLRAASEGAVRRIEELLAAEGRTTGDAVRAAMGTLVAGVDGQVKALVAAVDAQVKALAAATDAQTSALVAEIARRAPQIVESALQDAVQRLTGVVREEALVAGELIATMGHNAFELARRRFEAATGPACAEVERVAALAVELDRTLGTLARMVAEAGAGWDPKLAAARDALGRLGASLSMIEASHLITEQARVIGQVEAALRADGGEAG